MRRTRCWVRSLAVTALLVVPGARLASQDLRDLERRMDTLVARRNAAEALLVAYRGRPIAPRVFPDTVVMLDGAVRIVTTSEFLPLARDAAARADPFVRERSGTGVASMNGTVFALWTDSLRRADQGVIVSPRVNGREVNEQYVIANAVSLAEALEADAQSRIGMRDKPMFARWLSAGLPLTPATNADWRAVRLELVSSLSTIAHRCYTGELGACKATLGLVAEADPAKAWFDSVGRRAVVENARRVTRLDPRAVSACVLGSDPECIALMRNNSAFSMWLDAPGSARARFALLQEAFTEGGSGALTRLAASSDTPSAALSAIANMPADSLVARWQRHAHDGGIESEIATPVVALTAAVWFLMMGALSARSPRWR